MQGVRAQRAREAPGPAAASGRQLGGAALVRGLVSPPGYRSLCKPGLRAEGEGRVLYLT